MKAARFLAPSRPLQAVSEAEAGGAACGPGRPEEAPALGGKLVGELPGGALDRGLGGRDPRTGTPRWEIWALKRVAGHRAGVESSKVQMLPAETGTVKLGLLLQL